MPWKLGTRVRMRHDGWHLNPHPTVFWQGKNWNKQRRCFFGWCWYKDIQRLSLRITNTQCIAILPFIILYHIHHSVWLSYKYYVIIVMGLLTSLQNFFPSHHVGVSLRGCTGEPLSCMWHTPRWPNNLWNLLVSWQSRWTMTRNFWGVDVERVKVLDQPLSITSECLPSSIPTPVLSAPATISMSRFKSEPSYHAAIAAGFAWPSSNPQHAGEFLRQFLQYHPFGPIKISQSQLHTLQATWRCCICCMAFTKHKSNKQHPFIPFAKQHLYVQVVYLHDSY